MERTRFINIYLGINLNEQIIPSLLSFFPKITQRVELIVKNCRVQTDPRKIVRKSKTIYSAVEYLSVDQRRFLIKNKEIKG